MMYPNPYYRSYAVGSGPFDGQTLTPPPPSQPSFLNPDWSRVDIVGYFTDPNNALLFLGVGALGLIAGFVVKDKEPIKTIRLAAALGFLGLGAYNFTRR